MMAGIIGPVTGSRLNTVKAQKASATTNVAQIPLWHVPLKLKAGGELQDDTGGGLSNTTLLHSLKKN
tara:strand:+ start:2372 stop:2572 length:201 start_codon:yes stop_codon:yes gene_type:complete